MEPHISSGLYSVLAFVGMLVLLEGSRRLCVRRRPKDGEGERGSPGTIEGAAFALFGLVVAFTFSAAASRFNEKRVLIAEEANCIETAYLRLHLVSQTARPELQELFRGYVDSQLETYRKLPNMSAAEAEIAKSKKIQREIWTNAVNATQNLGQELTVSGLAAQPNNQPQPAATQPASSQPEASSAPKTSGAHASLTKPAQNGATMVASAQTEQSQNVAAKSPGSNAPAEPDESVFTMRKMVSEVYLLFTVTDKHGRYIRSLKRDDFKILDDGKPPKEILSFSSETDLPLQVGLLIDASQSVSRRFKFEQEAAIEFLKQTLRPKYDQALVIGFDLTPKVMQDFTDDTEKLSVAIRALRPSSLTAMYDTLYYACRDKLLKQARVSPARRAIILLSDGNDNSSSVTREKAIEMAQWAEVSVYTISTTPTGSGGHGNKTLEHIAETTGGRSYAPSRITELENVFAAIQEDLRSQYAVSYKPAAFMPDGHYRTIEVRAPAQQGLRIRSRKGYRVPAEYDAPNR